MLAALALAVAIVAAPAVESKEAEDQPPSRDLMCRGIRLQGEGDWASWWAVNRAALTKPVYRASAFAPPGAPAKAPVIDAAARTRAREALLAELESKDGLVASEAALALGRAGDPHDIATLAKIVGDDRKSNAGRMRSRAALGLGFLPMGDNAQATQARGALLTVLEGARGDKTHHLYVWSGAAWALAMRGDTAALPRLLDLNRDAWSGDTRLAVNGEVLGAVWCAIAALGGDRALPVLESGLKTRKPPTSGNKDCSWAACHAATRIPGAATLQLLRTAARDDREVLRRVALAALGAVADGADDETAKLLRAAMFDDRDSCSRQAAAIALGRMNHSSSTAALVRGLTVRLSNRDLKDTNMVSDRGAVILGLGLRLRGNPDPKTAARLARMLDDSHTQDEQAALCVACALAGVQTARGRIAELVMRGKGDILGPSAASALGLLGAGPAERKILHEAVEQSVFADLRGEAALALGQLGDHTVVDRLRAIITSKSAHDVDQATAAACLGFVGDDADIDFMIGAMVVSRGLWTFAEACPAAR